MTGVRWTLLRVLFLLAVVAGAWWSWRDSGDQLVVALGRVGVVQVAAATVLVLMGLLLTGWVWLIALRAFEVEGSAGGLVPQFFVAQLGKYIPGSVWLFAAQGALGARYGIPSRVTASATVLFLGLHVATGLTLAGLLGGLTSMPATMVAFSPAVAVVGLVGLLPMVHRMVGGRLAGRPCTWGVRRSVVGATMMMLVWGCYASALVVLVPDPDIGLALTLGAAFALAHAAGVAIPIAPAGLGARDAVLALLIAPVLGAGPAAAVAVLARLLHTVADFLLAGASWVLLRTSDARRPSGGARDEH